MTHSLTIRPGPGVSIDYYERAPRVSLCTITRLYGHTTVKIRIDRDADAQLASEIQQSIIWWALSEAMKQRAANNNRRVRDWAPTLERVER